MEDYDDYLENHDYWARWATAKEEAYWREKQAEWDWEQTQPLPDEAYYSPTNQQEDAQASN